MRFQFNASPRAFLQTLLGLRLAAICCEVITIVVVSAWLRVELPLTAMAVPIIGLALLELVSTLRLGATWPVTEIEVVLLLFIDITALTALLYFSGGTTNPFASLYLIPIALAAVTLGVGYVVTITTVCLGCYLWLMHYFVPLRFVDETLKGAFNLHVIGMGVNFAFSGVLLAAVVATLSLKGRRREQELARMREETLRLDHLNALGLMAAGAAHELSTPLFAISLLVSEIKREAATDAQLADDLGLLAKQVQVCKEKLTRLLETSGKPRSNGLSAVPVKALVQKSIEDWRVVRPDVQFEINWDQCDDNPVLSVDDGFGQALTSLLNNAADASKAAGSSRVSMTVTHTTGKVCIYIDDEGHGLSSTAQQLAGKTVFTTKSDGFGLGLILSHANLNRAGGELTLMKRPHGGTRTVIEIPAELETMDMGND